MTTYVALLRGVNVGGNNRIAMADLRRWITALGFHGVASYIQSGNVVLSGSSHPTAEVASAVRAAIAGQSGLDVAVMVRTRDELAKVIAGNPYPEADDEPTKVHVAFLTDDADLTGLEAVDPASYAPDEWTSGPGVLYLRFPNGTASSKLAVVLGRTRTGVMSTVRNWRTVTKLLELAPA